MNNKGVITIDFLFAFTFIFGLVYLLFVVCFTFFMVEVTQYITFSSARSYLAAHNTNQKQLEMGNQKFLQLTQSELSPVKGILGNLKWYQISSPLIGKFGDDGFNYPQVEGQVLLDEYDVTTSDQNTFWGMRVEFIPKVLDFSVPFVGSTNEKGEGTGEIFKSNIQSFLGREVSSEECLNMQTNRWNLIKSKSSKYSQYPNMAMPKVADNGC
ncbi:MAG: hypothetical protein MK008_09455 [Bdellovibrionales bacterium]|nr:hypothetical protein [Bdellovibrionales bacterium]